jgi:hypothetical protein
MQDFEPGVDGWQRIESAYGVNLSENLKKELSSIFDEYLEEAAFEANAPFRSDVRRRIEEILRDASTFFNTLQVSKFQPSDTEGDAGADADVEARGLIQSNFHDQNLQPRCTIEAMTSLMTSFVAACELARRQAKEPDEIQGEFRKGEAWDIMICRVLSVLEREGLPTGARKDSDYNRSSRFVAFILEIRNLFPKQFQRHHTANSLPDAVHKARKLLPRGH